MSKKRLIIILSLLSIALFSCLTRLLVAGDSEIVLQVTGFERKGQVKDLPELKLDFRYAPKRWQACIRLRRRTVL